MLGSKYDEAVETIIGATDFDKIRRMMAAVGWEWRNSGTPSLDDLERCARVLFKSLAEQIKNDPKKSHYLHSTGGLVVEYFRDETGEELKLQFVGESNEFSADTFDPMAEDYSDWV